VLQSENIVRFSSTTAFFRPITAGHSLQVGSGWEVGCRTPFLDGALRLIAAFGTGTMSPNRNQRFGNRLERTPLVPLTEGDTLCTVLMG
jgi:hypothetical protein